MSVTARSVTKRSGFVQPELQAELARLREINNHTNLYWLALEYATIAVIATLTIAFAELRLGWGLSWIWNVPVFGLAIILMGGVQHRLAGLGHEASHYSLLHNKLANDLVGDLFCMLPLITNVHFYRLFHMAHHQYVNDPELDPDLVNLGKGKRVDEFPMKRNEFIAKVYLVFVTAPLTFSRYQWAYFYVNVLGKGGNTYMKRVPDGDASYARPRLGTLLGIGYIAGFLVVHYFLTRTNNSLWLIPTWFIGLVGVVLVMRQLPDSAMFRSPFRQPYDERVAGLMRLAFLTGGLVMLGLLWPISHGKAGMYFNLLWSVPLVTTMPFYMLLRDTYQHTNGDTDRITNTRVFFADAFTRWAVFVYGQDIHVPHHIFPAVPHYNLMRLHEALKKWNPEYAQDVVECHGTFSNRKGQPTILDVMTDGAE